MTAGHSWKIRNDVSVLRKQRTDTLPGCIAIFCASYDKKRGLTYFPVLRLILIDKI